MEYLIVEQFCSRYQCERMLAGFDAAPIGLTQKDATANWNFSDQSGPTCSTGSGLALKFRDTSNLGRKRALCQQLADELNLLAAMIDRQQHHGVAIDWPHLVLAGTVPGQGLRVQLNRAQDSIVLSAPTLAAHPELLNPLLPWLQARAAGRALSVTLRDAETLLPETASRARNVLTLGPE